MTQAQRTEQAQLEQIVAGCGRSSNQDGHGAFNPSDLVFTAISLTAPQA